MPEKRRGTVQLHIRVEKKLIERLEQWLDRAGRTAFGARGAEIERMIKEGVAKRERKEKRK